MICASRRRRPSDAVFAPHVRASGRARRHRRGRPVRASHGGDRRRDPPPSPREAVSAHRRPLHRSTLVDLFHRTAEILDPLSKRLLELIPKSEIVQADETTIRAQAKGKTRTSWLWTFLATSTAATTRSPCPAGGSASAASPTSAGHFSTPSRRRPSRSVRWTSSSKSTRSSVPRSTTRFTTRTRTSRCARSVAREVMDECKAWLEAERPKHLPKGPMG